MDIDRERCLGWSLHTIVWDLGLRLSLTKHRPSPSRFYDPEEDSEDDSKYEGQLLLTFLDVQSFAFVDGYCLSHYWDVGDDQPLLRELSHDKKFTHLADHKIFEDHFDKPFRLFRLTAGDDCIEVLVRNGKLPQVEWTPAAS
jgi:hypothetical protein